MLPFPVAGIGASAGGLEAFIELLRSLRSDAGMAYVFVQHLDPTHPSTLPELLSAASPVPVQQVFNGIQLERDHVYVIPPNSSMTIADGHLRLSPRHASGGGGVPMPINDFFRSLAERQGPRAIGVVLSGTATDGAAGLQAIKGAGGITFAQTEASAKFPGMPRSAMATGCVDFVLAPGDIAGVLARISHHHYLAAADAGAQPDAGDDSAEIAGILSVLRRSCGVDFSQYKVATLRRRIRRRMLLQRLDQIKDYTRSVQLDAAEADALCQDLLIRVTSFFRDPDVFDALKHTVFPELARSRPPDAPIRVWVPGCSTGEEAYSLAMCLAEYLAELSDPPTVQLYGTDVNETTILKARVGLYLDSITADVSPDRLRRFFTKEGSGYRIIRTIRDRCVFAKQDLTRDPPFSQIDLISCRNVLIYLTQPLQKRVFTLFHYALRANGVLLLGGAESVAAFPELFVSADKKNRLYHKTSAPPGLLHFDMLTGRRRAALSGHARPESIEVATPRDLQREADRVVLATLAPVGVVVNDQLEVIQFRGRTIPFLEPPQGAATYHLLKMVQREFLGPLRAAVEEARQTAVAVDTPNIKTSVEGHPAMVTLRVLPFRAVPSGQRFFVVLFERQGGTRRTRASLRALPGAQPDGRGRSRRARELEQELAATREYMQAIVQEQEATNEELRSSTEEIQSSYEELQSSNEELETAKEELQSGNEELTTVNEELHRRTFDLAEANNDLTNFLASVNIPLIRVGNDLRIRRFTPNADRVLNVIASDVGRPIGDIKLKVLIPDFETRIVRVMDALTVTELEAQDTEGHWWSVRIRPYRTSDRKIDGVVIAFVDIDSLTEMGRAAHLGRVRVERIHDIITALNQALTGAQVAAILAREGREAIGADGALVAVQRFGGPWEPLFEAGYLPGQVEELLRVANRGVAPMGWAAASREMVALTSPTDIATRFPEAAPALAAIGARSYLAVPVEVGADRIAVLGLFFRGERMLDQPDLQVMNVVAQLAGHAFVRADQSTRDRLLREQDAVLRRERDAALEVTRELVTLLSTELLAPLAELTERKTDSRVTREAAQVIALVEELAHVVSGTEPIPGPTVPVADVIERAITAVAPLAAARELSVRADQRFAAAEVTVGAEVRSILVSLLVGLMYVTEGGAVSVGAHAADNAVLIEVHAHGRAGTAQRLVRAASLLSTDEAPPAGRDAATEPGARLAFAVMRQAAARTAADVVTAADGTTDAHVRIRVPLRAALDQTARGAT